MSVSAQLAAGREKNTSTHHVEDMRVVGGHVNRLLGCSKTVGSEEFVSQSKIKHSHSLSIAQDDLSSEPTPPVRQAGARWHVSQLRLAWILLPSPHRETRGCYCSRFPSSLLHYNLHTELPEFFVESDNFITVCISPPMPLDSDA